MEPHRALFILEIVEEIFRHLAGFEDPRSRRALARAARTGTLFYTPAINVLWRVLPSSLVPLLQLLPNFQLKSSVPFNQTVKPEEWDKFFSRAVLVRALSYKQERGIHSSVYEEIQRAANSRQTTLLPSLRSLKWRQAQETDGTIMMFATPSLQHLTIDIYQPQRVLHDEEDRENSSIPTFLSQVTSAKVLRLSGPCPRRWLWPILQLRSLHSLRLGLTSRTVDVQFLLDLSYLEQLSELHVEVDIVELSEELDMTTHRGFSSLERLVISGSPRTLDAVFGMMTSPSLKDLALTTNSLADTDGWEKCFTQLGTKFQSSLLRFGIRILHLEYELQSLAIETAETTSIITFLRPLLGITSLEVLRFDNHDITTHLSIADIATLSACWPKLIELTIWYQRRTAGTTTVPLPTFHALFIFAVNCPHLLSISIELDAQNPPAVDAQLKISAHPLNRLDLLGNTIITDRDHPMIVKFLKTVFPNLYWLGVYCYKKQANDLWKSVGQCLPSLQAARKADWNGRFKLPGRKWKHITRP